MNVVGWLFQSRNLQADWKVHDQTHWETERVVGSVDGNQVNGSELWFANAWLYLAEFGALLDDDHPALLDFLQEAQHRVEA